MYQQLESTSNNDLGLLSIDVDERESLNLLFDSFKLNTTESSIYYFDFEVSSDHKMGTITPTTVGICKNNLQIQINNEDFINDCINKLKILEKRAIEDDVKKTKEIEEVNNLCESLKSKLCKSEQKELLSIHNQIGKKLESINKLEESEKGLKESIDVLKRDNQCRNVAHIENSAIVPILYQENIESIDSKKPIVLHYHIDSSKLKHIVGQYLDNDMIYPIEKVLFLKALEHLEKSLSRVVLVDFFVRNGNIIKSSKDSEFPETHTIVLFKYKNSEIIIFDPNQYKFSGFLAKLLSGICKADFKLNEPNLYNIEDDNPEKRDCTDISVKIALEILEQPGNELSEIQDRIFKMFCNDTKANPILKSVQKCGIPKIGLRNMHSSNKDLRASTFDNFKTLSEMCKK